MLIAFKDGARINAASALRAQAPFSCPMCRQDVLLRQGTVRVAHFAHRRTVAEACAYGFGETMMHLHAKQVLCDALGRGGYRAEPEVPLGSQRADVFVEDGETGFVIELQHSSIDPREVERRTRGYQDQGLYVAWVSLVDLDYQPCVQDRASVDGAAGMLRYSPRPFERWLESFNFGQLLLFNPFLGGLLAAEFRAHKREVAASTWRGIRGESITVGGYSRTSTRYVNLQPEFLPLERLLLAKAWRSTELRRSGMCFPRGGLARFEVATPQAWARHGQPAACRLPMSQAVAAAVTPQSGLSS